MLRISFIKFIWPRLIVFIVLLQITYVPKKYIIIISNSLFTKFLILFIEFILLLKMNKSSIYNARNTYIFFSSLKTNTLRFDAHLFKPIFRKQELIFVFHTCWAYFKPHMDFLSLHNKFILPTISYLSSCFMKTFSMRSHLRKHFTSIWWILKLEVATRASKVPIDVNLAIKVNVSKKSTPLVCAKPFANKHALYLSISLLNFHLILKTHLFPMAFLPFGSFGKS